MLLYLTLAYSVVCALIIFGTLFLSQNLQRTRNEIVAKEFEKSKDILKEKVESFVHGLQGTGGIYHLNKYKHDPAFFKKYAEFRNNFINFPGALGFGFIRAVPKKETKRYHEMMRKIDPSFEIKSLGDDSSDYYFVIEEIQPHPRNESARYLDIGSEMNRRSGALRAIETGLPVLSPSITLVQDQTKTPGFLFFLPIYKTNTPPFSAEDRRKNIVGFAYAPILLTPLMNYLQTYASDKLYFSVTDVTDSSVEVLFQDKKYEKINRSEDALKFSTVLSLAERKWKLSAAKDNDDWLSSASSIPILVGALIWVIFSVLFWQLKTQQTKSYAQEIVLEKITTFQSGILDSATYSIISVDQNGKILTFNLASEKLLGFREKDVIKKYPITKIFAPSSLPKLSIEANAPTDVEINHEFLELVHLASERGSDVREVTYLKKTGEELPVRLTISILKTDDSLIGYLFIAEDLTHNKHLEKMVESQRASMLHSSKMSALGEMAAGISHEINNPLAIITGISMVLELQLETNRTLSYEIAKPQLTKIQKTIDRIAKIIQGLRTFAHESPIGDKSIISISEVVNDTLPLCQERFRIHNVTIETTCDSDLLVLGQANQISQILLNLMNNSFDALVDMPTKRIEIHAYKSNNSIFVTVTDSGNKIPPHIVGRLMEPFFTTKQVGKGTGLGLSISLGIAQAHGGTLYYNASHPKNQFVLQFPASRT